MTEAKKGGGDAAEARTGQQDLQDAETPAGEAPTETGEAAAAPSPEDRIAVLEAEAASLKDQLLRALAEAENTRRRTERDRQETARYGAAGLARDLLSVADNLRRALDSLPEGARAGGDEAMRNFIEGVDLIEKELIAAFGKHAIARIEPLGQPFDHGFHQAMFEIEDKDKPAGTVLQVLQAGYKLHDRLLRPAMVGVAKGGPKAEKPKEDHPK